VFSKPAVKDLLKRYTLVQLYTDKVPVKYEPTTSADENRDLQNSRFGTAELPLYVILKPLPGGKFEEVGRYAEGVISDAAGFMRFLRDPLAPSETAVTARAE
jgi:hypothetical protein